MSSVTRDSSQLTAVKWRTIALPVEHGGWGFTLEPVVLGLLVAPSAAGWEISVAAVAVFLARRPFKLVSTDVVRRRILERTKVATAFAALYGVAAALGLIGATVTAAGPFWQPVAVATPLAAIAVYADAHSRSRTLVAEMAGATAMGATVAMITLANGWEAYRAYGLWLVLAARALATIPLVRAQIRRVHGRPVGAAAVMAVQVVTVTGMMLAALAGVVPWLSVVALGAVGLLAYVSLRRPAVAAKTVGWTQIIVGLGLVLATALGVALNW